MLPVVELLLRLEGWDPFEILLQEERYRGFLHTPRSANQHDRRYQVDINSIATREWSIEY